MMGGVVLAAWVQAVLTGLAILAAVAVPYVQRHLDTLGDQRRRLDVRTSRWEPTGLRIEIRYVPEFMSIGLSARVTVLSPIPAILKPGRPVTNPAPVVGGGYTRFELAGYFIGHSGTIRLADVDGGPEPVLRGVVFLGTANAEQKPIILARLRVEIWTDANVRLVSQVMVVSSAESNEPLHPH